MIAEIHGKISSMNSNLTERSEDELTGNFFGNLRYLPFNRGLKHILKGCVYPAELDVVFDSLDVEVWHDNVTFWDKRYEGVEPDVLIEFDKMVIAVEVKYYSGLSSDDDVDNSRDNQEWKESSNQLAREGKMLEHIADGRTKVLIFLAPEASAHQVYADVKNRNLLNGDVLFGYMTWQKAYDALQDITTENPFEKVAVDDLIAFLYKKGFEGFRSFDIKRAEVERGLHYEFG